MADPESKAVGFNSLVAVLREQVPASTMAALVQALPPETAHLVEHPPLPVRWLAQTHTFALMRAACDRVFGGDEEKTSELAQRAVVRDLNSLYRLFIRLSSPEFVIGRAAAMWQTYWRNNGAVRVEREGPTSVLVQYEGMVGATSLFWAIQCGTLRGVMQATGVQGIEVRVVGDRDDPHRCTVRARWR